MLAAVLTLCSLAAALSSAHDEQLIGWLGETYGPGGPKSASPTNGTGASGMEVLSWQPRIFHYKGFLSEAETSHIRQWAGPRVVRSHVSNAKTGAGELSNVRTSSGVFVQRAQDQVVARIEQRIAMWTMLPEENGEAMNVLRYQLGQEYRPHADYFSFEGRDDNGGNRMATVLMYLSDVEEGGETVFPKVQPLPHQLRRDSGFSECAKKGLAVRPRRGDAIAFWSIKPSGVFDPKSMHGACPVIKGEKWSMTKWIRVGTFNSGEKVVRQIYAPSPPPATPGCKDTADGCPSWAESGECEENPGYMVGSRQQPGACLLSCGRCDLMAAQGAR